MSNFFVGLLFLLAVVVAVELIAWLLIPRLTQKPLPIQTYDRRRNPWTVFSNRPGFKHATHSRSGTGNIVTDRFGLLSDKPLVAPKPNDVMRIFLSGGSGAMSGGQNPRYNITHPYPSSLYAHDLSIAGALERRLQSDRPDLKVEVHVSAVSTRTTDQSLVDYIVTLAALEPDVVIEFGGFNDLGIIASGRPFEFTESLWDELFSKLHEPQVPWSRSNVITAFRLATSSAEDLLVPSYQESQATPLPDRRDYEKRRATLESRGVAYSEMIGRYAGVTSADDVAFIFALQPILFRKKNKNLTTREQQLLDQHAPMEFGLAEKFASDHFTDLLASISDGTDALLVGRWMFDEGLADEIKTATTAQGQSFVDMHEHMHRLTPETELFTDYTHLTSDGHQWVAEILADCISGDDVQTAATS